MSPYVRPPFQPNRPVSGVGSLLAGSRLTGSFEAGWIETGWYEAGSRLEGRSVSLPALCADLWTGLLAALLLLGLCVGSSHAQLSVGERSEALDALSSAARAAVLRVDSALVPATRPTDEGRIDRRTGIVRADYRPIAQAPLPADPETAARRFLSLQADRYGLAPRREELALVRAVQSAAGRHITFQQEMRGVPVYQSRIKVNLDARNRPIAVFNGLKIAASDRREEALRSLPTTPSISADRARSLVEQAVASKDGSPQSGSPGGATSAEPELRIYPSDPPRLAWRVVAWPQGISAEWVMLIDATDGSFLAGFNTAISRKRSSHSPSTTKSPTPSDRSAPSSRANGAGSGLRSIPGGPSAQPAADSDQTTSPSPTGSAEARPGKSPQRTSTTGSGLVFLPDPITSSGAGSYGDPFTDQDDESYPEIAAEQQVGTLPGLTRQDGTYRLRNDRIAITDFSPAGHDFPVPTESHPDSFRYDRDDDRFEAVNVYYHVQRAVDHILARDPGFENLFDRQLALSPHGEGSRDNSFYTPNRHRISFGDGGVDDAEDANIIWHELGHALLQEATPGLLESFGWSEGRAFHEGWSDYWAGSFRRSFQNDYEHDVDWRELFPWDGNNPFWAGRRIENDGVYPDGLTSDNIYTDGLLWATTAMDIFGKLDGRYGLQRAREISDRLHLQSHAFLSAASFTMRDAAVALLMADLEIYDGAHRSLLLEELSTDGFVDPSAFGPRIALDPATDVSYENGTVQVSARIRPRTFGVQGASVHYRRFGSGSGFGTAPLERSSGDRFSGNVSVSPEPGLLAYYLSAEDSLGVEQQLPAGAPGRTFFVPIGTARQEDLLASPRPSGGWVADSIGWSVDGSPESVAEQSDEPRGSLVFAPIDVVEADDAQSFAILSHRFRSQFAAAANVKISADGGRTWQVLEPLEGYPVGPGGERPLSGEPSFEPVGSGTRDQYVFDLSRWAGETVRMRLDFAADHRLGTGDRWAVGQFETIQIAGEPSLEPERTLTLFSNFPNPVSTSSTFHYRIPETGPVRAEVYDALGRRVAVLLDAEREAGTHGLSVRAEGWAPGRYFLRIRSAGKSRTEPFTVIR